MAFETQEVLYNLSCLLDLSSWSERSQKFFSWISVISVELNSYLQTSNFRYSCLFLANFLFNTFILHQTFSNTCFLFPFFLLISSLSFLQFYLLWGTSESIYNHSFTVASSALPFVWGACKFSAFAYSPRTQDQEWRAQLAGVCLGIQSSSGQAGEWNSRHHLLLLLLLSISCSPSYTEIQGKRKSPLRVKCTFEFFLMKSINS